MNPVDFVVSTILAVFAIATLTRAVTWPSRPPARAGQLPQPLRPFIDGFSTVGPDNAHARAFALHQSVMELAAEICACPSCGSDPAIHQLPKKWPDVIRFAPGGLATAGPMYCGVCGVEAVNDNDLVWK